MRFIGSIALWAIHDCVTPFNAGMHIPVYICAALDDWKLQAILWGKKAHLHSCWTLSGVSSLKKKHGSWWEIATQKSRFIGEIMSNPNWSWWKSHKLTAKNLNDKRCRPDTVVTRKIPAAEPQQGRTWSCEGTWGAEGPDGEFQRENDEWKVGRMTYEHMICNQTK